MKRILIFGAGKIGRAFIAQLFSQSGYEIIFVDAIREMVEALNRQGQYKVVIRDQEPGVIWVNRVRAVHTSDIDEIVGEIKDVDIIACCVGSHALKEIAPLIAKGLSDKYASHPQKKTDIILAENLRNAATCFSRELASCMPETFPLDNTVGLVETSIGKMVPIMSRLETDEDPLQVKAEAYNTLIVDKKGFKNDIPKIEHLAPKENIKAWVDRKLFIHNLGHAMAAYFGHYYFPQFSYVHEALSVKVIKDHTRAAMQESGQVLLAMYPAEFTGEQITEHIEDLLSRFENRSLKDTIYRVGSDLRRKLGPSDRIATPIRYAIKYKLPFKHIIKGYEAAFHFKAKFSHLENEDDRFITSLYEEMGLAYMMREISGLDPEKCMEAFSDKQYNI